MRQQIHYPCELYSNSVCSSSALQARTRKFTLQPSCYLLLFLNPKLSATVYNFIFTTLCLCPYHINSNSYRYSEYLHSQTGLLSLLMLFLDSKGQISSENKTGSHECSFAFWTLAFSFITIWFYFDIICR